MLTLGGALLASGLLSACIGGQNGAATAVTPPAVANTAPLVVDSGPAGATGSINHAYVTVTVCAPGSKSACATVDHVLLDTGSFGLRLVRSILTAHQLALSAEADASGRSVEECVSFNGGQTWGPVAPADVSIAGETAAKVPVQIMDDTGAGAPPPATCGANGTLINGVTGFNANGVLGVGVFAQDCGQACVAAGAPLPVYYACTSAGVCTAENEPLTAQVTNPVAQFAADNNGVIVELPNLQNANGDVSVQGSLIFGIATQADNPLPATGIIVLGANGSGDFTATYNGNPTVLPALIDSGTDSYAFNDPSLGVCATGAFVGYYCPVVAPQSAFAINTGVGANPVTDTVDFAIADPNTFVAGAAAFIDLAGGGGSTTFTWGMPFFYGRKIYIGIDQRVADIYTGPYYAY
jgi:hypothetical protein